MSSAPFFLRGHPFHDTESCNERRRRRDLVSLGLGFLGPWSPDEARLGADLDWESAIADDVDSACLTQGVRPRHAHEDPPQVKGGVHRHDLRLQSVAARVRGSVQGKEGGAQGEARAKSWGCGSKKEEDGKEAWSTG